MSSNHVGVNQSEALKNLADQLMEQFAAAGNSTGIWKNSDVIKAGVALANRWEFSIAKGPGTDPFGQDYMTVELRPKGASPGYFGKGIMSDRYHGGLLPLFPTTEEWYDPEGSGYLMSSPAVIDIVATVQELEALGFEWSEDYQREWVVKSSCKEHDDALQEILQNRSVLVKPNWP